MKSGYGKIVDGGIQMDKLLHVKIALVTASFNSEITMELKEGAIRTLRHWRLPEENVMTMDVPGSYELSLAAGWALKAGYDAVIALGCVIRGETTHYDYVCQSAERTLSDLQVAYLRPVVFGVLTTENFDQAKARAGGTHGHKGEEAARVALRMLSLKEEFRPFLTEELNPLNRDK